MTTHERSSPMATKAESSSKHLSAVRALLEQI